jgi:hypothetical protein
MPSAQPSYDALQIMNALNATAAAAALVAAFVAALHASRIMAASPHCLINPVTTPHPTLPHT